MQDEHDPENRQFVQAPPGVQAGTPAPALADLRLPEAPGAWPGPVPWTAAEIALVVFLAVLWLGFASELLHAAGFYRWFYAPELLETARGGAGVKPEASRAAQARLNLWAVCLAFFLQLGSTLALLRFLSGTRPRDLGLRLRQFRRHALAGLVGAVVFTPGVLGVNLFVLLLYKRAGVGLTDEHAFSALGRQGLHTAEWAALVFAAVVAAPVWEELLFRGLIQPWVATRRLGPEIALAVAVLYTLGVRGQQLMGAYSRGPGPVFREALPVLVLVGLAGVHLWVRLRSRTQVGPAIFATAVLFAWFHAAVWPSPVALLWLGLGLGYLAWRTQSLVASIVVHSLFNTTACVLLALGIQN
jgi:membrane protease YdiL (CAAX protease family)